MSQLPALSLAAVPSRRARTIELAKEIESRGFSGIYCPSLGDALGLCLSMAHETSTIEFGTSIVNIYARNVLDYAATASYINEISEGRFRFGIGVSHAPANKQLGVNPGKPLGDIREFVETMRAQPRITLPPITLATMRDKMISTATEIGEGMVFANAARSAMPGSLERMPDVGDDFWIGNMIPTCISDDREAAAAVNRKTLQFYVALPNYRNYWKQNGYQEEMEAVEAALAAKDRAAIPGLLTDKWLSDVTLYGSADEVREGLQAWYDTGLK
ncbi:LLM class flavin-dependent oxidoreductase, partial [Acidimicrobiales bacterium]|nr:LLM class flavin-dependent oxidoreductase [Acidimicrobiales bacterium]